MLKSLFSQKNQGRIIVLVGLVVVVAAYIAVAGKTTISQNEDGTQSVKRSIFGFELGK